MELLYWAQKYGFKITHFKQGSVIDSPNHCYGHKLILQGEEISHEYVMGSSPQKTDLKKAIAMIKKWKKLAE